MSTTPILSSLFWKFWSPPLQMQFFLTLIFSVLTGNLNSQIAHPVPATYIGVSPKSSRISSKLHSIRLCCTLQDRYLSSVHLSKHRVWLNNCPPIWKRLMARLMRLCSLWKFHIAAMFAFGQRSSTSWYMSCEAYVSTPLCLQCGWRDNFYEHV